MCDGTFSVQSDLSSPTQPIEYLYVYIYNIFSHYTGRSNFCVKKKKNGDYILVWRYFLQYLCNAKFWGFSQASCTGKNIYYNQFSCTIVLENFSDKFFTRVVMVSFPVRTSASHVITFYIIAYILICICRIYFSQCIYCDLFVFLMFFFWNAK